MSRQLKTFLLFVCLILVLNGASNAQDNSENKKWYWAWRDDIGEVVAFTADGRINTLMKAVDSFNLTRINSQVGLGLFETENQYALYKLTSNDITQISAFFPGSLEENMRMRIGSAIIFAERWPYVLMTTAVIGSSEIWIINFETNSLQTFDEPDNCVFTSWPVFNRCIRFSRNGDTLRYIVGIEDDKVWSLRERTLATGEERIVYTWVNPYPYEDHVRTWCSPDTFAEKWLCNTEADFPKSFTLDYWLLFHDGEVQPVLSETESFVRWSVFLAGEDLVVIDAACEKDCAIQLYPSGEGNPVRFPLFISSRAMKNMSFIGDLWYADRGKLLLWDHGNILLYNNGQLSVAGQSPGTYIELHSSDEGWFLLHHPRYGHQLLDVWDTRVVLQIPNAISNGYFLENGFIGVDPWGSGHGLTGTTYVYSFLDEAAYQLPNYGFGDYFEILSGGEFLYAQGDESDELHKGIYRYNDREDTFILLTPNVADYVQRLDVKIE